MAIVVQNAVLLALGQSQGPLVLEEIAAMAGISFEQAWYAVLDLLEKRLVMPAGMGFYVLTRRNAEQYSA
jgi:predicted transcriptional regulator